LADKEPWQNAFDFGIIFVSSINKQFFTMVRCLLSLLLLGFYSLGSAQQYAAIMPSNSGGAKIGYYNLGTNSPAKILKDLGSIDYQKNTFTLLENGSSYAYVTVSGWNSIIHINDLEGKSKSVTLKNRKVLSLDYFDDLDRMVVTATRRIPNYYSFLEEDVSVIILDEVGTEDVSIEIPMASVFVPSLPYYGISTRQDGFGATQSLEYGMSLPTALQADGRLVFMARDIMGVPRLYTVNVRSKRIEFNTVLDHHILSLCPSKEEGKVKALFYNPKQSDDGKMDLQIADVSIHNGRMTKVTHVKSVESYNPAKPILDGTLTLDLNADKVIVSRVAGTNQVALYHAESNALIERKTVTPGVEISTWNNMSKPGAQALALNVKVFPNPTHGKFTVTTTEFLKMDGLKVYDMLGNLVKDYQVSSNSVSNDFDLTFLSKGFYMLSIEAKGQKFLYKITKY
jgi:hypothetical protein